ncbi:hypothetical protein M0802_000055 [Mischocyttarus mexicanus]|nr:hypothetical protein M0802_000055 [Mischocyttarus mexicanus]
MDYDDDGNNDDDEKMPGTLSKERRNSYIVPMIKMENDDFNSALCIEFLENLVLTSKPRYLIEVEEDEEDEEDEEEVKLIRDLPERYFGAPFSTVLIKALTSSRTKGSPYPPSQSDDTETRIRRMIGQYFGNNIYQKITVPMINYSFISFNPSKVIRQNLSKRNLRKGCKVIKRRSSSSSSSSNSSSSSSNSSSSNSSSSSSSRLNEKIPQQNIPIRIGKKDVCTLFESVSEIETRWRMKKRRWSTVRVKGYGVRGSGIDRTTKAAISMHDEESLDNIEQQLPPRSLVDDIEQENRSRGVDYLCA